MRIGFHAPLKSPLHPVPSGDRQMARLLVRALELGGHAVTLASELRSYMPEPDAERFAALRREAACEIERIAATWDYGGAPDLWLSYHSYYKAPDLIAPALCARFGVPVVTVEASYAGKRDAGPWAAMQAAAVETVRQAALNLSFTQRDQEGLARLVPAERLARLSPFIDTAPFQGREPRQGGRRIVTVAMMRPGDKLESYTMLAQALLRIADRDWTLRIVGDGPARQQVRALFDAGPRVEWLGEVPPDEVVAHLDGALYAWPGYGEAYGLAYLEAQAAGLPVVAQATAGVPEVVRDGETGLLTPEGDVGAYAGALASLLDGDDRCRAMGEAARRFVLSERSLEAASARLSALIEKAVRG